MQNQISQETLLRILQEGEVLPPYVEIDDEILRTKDAAEEQFDMEMEHAEAQFEMQQSFTPKETKAASLQVRLPADPAKDQTPCPLR